jgi:hypothetical protein
MIEYKNIDVKKGLKKKGKINRNGGRALRRPVHAK